MASFTVRGGRIYAKIKDVTGEWRRLKTQFLDGQQAEAEKWAASREAKVAAALNAMPTGARGPLTVTLYAQAWLAKRRNATIADDRARMENHVIPRIGQLLVVDVRPRHLRDLIEALKNDTTLAPRTIRTISGLVHSMFKSAVIDEVIAENPAKYERGVLPKKLDKDPSWRRQAIYTRPEVEQLISDERIPLDRRVLYALKFFTGRHSEISGLTWSQYDPSAAPLGALALDDTKSDVPRAIPVHPTLAAVLAQWKLGGWEDFFGHSPKPDDLIVPTRNLTRRDANEAQRQLLYDLEKIGLRVKAGKERNRRGHDLRRTLITLARTDGAIDAVLKVITHGPTTQQMIDLYSSFPWETLCAEMAKLKIELREGQIIAMAANDPGSVRGPSLVQPRKTVARGGLERFNERPRRDSNPRKDACGNTRDEQTREVGAGRVLPFLAGEGSLDHGVVQDLRSACDVGLEMMAARLKSHPH